MLPVPVAARPIEGLLFVHEYTSPPGPPGSATDTVVPVWHTVWSAVGMSGDGVASTYSVFDAHAPGPCPAHTVYGTRTEPWKPGWGRNV